MGDRFTGYAALGVAFASGDVLALRRFPITAQGSAYTAVWHCSPTGRWTFYTDVADEGCAKYFGPALDEVIVAPIRIEWSSPRRVSIAIDGGRRMTWSLLMRSTWFTRAYNRWGLAVVPAFLKYPRLLTLASEVARVLLRTGPLSPLGGTPSGARFLGRPWALWIIRSSRACIDGRDTGPDCALDRTLILGDFVIPRRGVFAAAHLSVDRSRVGW